MATWSISVSTSGTVATEDGDLVLPDLFAPLGVVDAETLLGSEAQDTDLALVLVAMDAPRRLARVIEGVDRRQQRLDAALADELVGRPRLVVVGEVRGDETLQLHPEVAVVELDHVARRRRAGHHGAAPLADEDRGAHGVAAGVLEHDVGVVAHEAADVLAEPPPLALVVGVVVDPELVAAGPAVDDGFHAE